MSYIFFDILVESKKRTSITIPSPSFNFKIFGSKVCDKISDKIKKSNFSARQNLLTFEGSNESLERKKLIKISFI